jgi:signal transduction histidine kinase/ligand-binding sensor domain-containing protein
VSTAVAARDRRWYFSRMKFLRERARLVRRFFCGAGIAGGFMLQYLPAADYHVTTWGVDEGLPQSSVTDIAQTPDGFLWIGTLFSGLSRFDGVRFVNFDSANTPSLINPGVRRLLVDARGNLWVNDYGGNLLLRQGNTFVKVGEDFRLGSLIGERRGRVTFSTIDGELITGRRGTDGTWTWQHIKPPFAGGAIYGCEDAEGVLWFQAPLGKIARFKNGHFELPDAWPGLSGKKIQSLAADCDGRVWAGTEAELARWEHGAFTNLNPGGPGQKMSVRRLTPLPDGGLWVEADGKYFVVDQNHWSAPVAEWNGDLVPWSHFRTLRVDANGGLWISLGDDGLVHISRDGKLTRVTSAEGLPSQLVQALYCSREGSVWAGYHRGGLLQLRLETFHSVARSEGLQDTLVTSITQDSSGAIWFGTAGGSVARRAEGVVQTFSLPVAGGAFCQDVVVGAGTNGRVWIGTGGNGLLLWENGQFKRVLQPAEIPQNVRQMRVARNGDVWFANFGGLFRYDGKNLQRILKPNGNREVVAALAQTSDGAIWMGTFGGELRRWLAGQLTIFKPHDNQPAFRFWALWPEADGTIWIGTMGGGLLRFQNGTFTRFTTADGLADNYISHILADDQGNLWLGSRVGVMRVPKANLNAAATDKTPLRCRLFGRSDGLPTVAMTLEFQPSCLKARDGVLWFGSPKGASWVNPSDVRPAALAPSVQIESAQVDNTAREISGINSPAEFPALDIEPGAKNVEVHFDAPGFTAPELMRFKYRLEPLDKDWIDLGGRRGVSFPSLRAGEYVFRVLAENSDGVPGGQSAGLRLRVEPHLWERKSFQLPMLFVLLGGVAFSVRRVTQRRLHRKLETLRQQHAVERERSRIAQDLHDDLGAGLTEISMKGDLATNPLLPAHESQQYTRDMSQCAREMVQRMDEIVWAVNPQNDSIDSLSVYACQYAQRLLVPLGIDCRLDVQPGLPGISLNAEQRYNFFLAFKETVNNVARHSGAKELHFTVQIESGRLCFLLEDNGRGFEPGAAASGADGLCNIRARIARMGGDCEIFSQPGKGTRVSLRVPLAAAPVGG